MTGQPHTEINATPKVSVIIPCYNQGRFLDEAVDSVLAQTMQDFEIIIVNDGSTEDFTNKLLDSYGRPKTTVYTIENSGLPAARNHGINQSHGKYILPLDADDKIAPEFLEKCCKLLDAHSLIGFVYTYVKFFGGEEGSWQTGHYDERRLLVGNMVSVCSLIRREAFESAGGYNENMKPGFEDWDLWVGLAEKGWEGHRITEYLFLYRKRKGTMSSKAEKPENRIKLVEQICRNHPEIYKRHLAYVVAEKEKLILTRQKQFEMLEQWRNQHSLAVNIVSGISALIKGVAPGLLKNSLCKKTERSLRRFLRRFMATGKFNFPLIHKHNGAKPKIAYIVPGLGITGGIGVICQHCNRLKKRGYDVTLVNANPVDFFSLDWFDGQSVRVRSLDKIDGHYDIAIATGWNTAYTLLGFPAKEKYYFVQSDESRFYSADDELAKMALDTYSFKFKYLTEARWIRKWLDDDFGHEAVYVPNGLDPELFHPAKPLEPKGSRVRVLLEGAIDLPFKGMEQAFEVVRDIDCEVWCVSSSGRPSAAWRCDRFFEYVPMNEMKHIYSSCDVLLKLSSVEGVFGPPLEMMACGGSCIVGKVNGHDEYIVNGHNAVVVERGDVEGAKAALTKLIEDEEFRKKLIEGGLKTAAEMRWETTIDKLEEVFNR
jgi:glycosyltransferase involved in cell wall biosynthesis